MQLNFNNIYENFQQIFPDASINLKGITFFSPWAIGLICLKAIENMRIPDKKLVLPKSADALSYLKRMHFDELMGELSYKSDLSDLEKLVKNEKDNLNVHEIMHCDFRDTFSARLYSKIRLMFKNFGMKDEDEQRATALIGELGNNVFDHNDGLWPTDVRGSIITAQHYPKIKTIEVVVADPGVGFLNSLKLAKPELNNSIDAIKEGLRGVSGRIKEDRGNGLKLIQDWTINKFDGTVRIHSGDGLVVVDKNGQSAKNVPSILGTLTELVVVYK